MTQHISDLADAVMPLVAADFAALYPAAPAIVHSVSTRALAEHAAPPRVVWVPSRDDYQGPQKRPRGGQSGQHSLATRVAGVQVVCWGESIDATEDLVECIVRHLLRVAGSGATGITVTGGQWVDATGVTTLGEDYALSIAFPVDVRASRTADTTASVIPALDTAHSTPGDGFIDAGEP